MNHSQTMETPKHWPPYYRKMKSSELVQMWRRKKNEHCYKPEDTMLNAYILILTTIL